MIYEAVKESDLSKCKLIFGEDRSGHDTPLIIACRSKDIDVVNMLLSHGMSTVFKPTSGEYPLITAIENSSTKIIEALLQNCACVDCVSQSGKTALCSACDIGNIDSVRVLLKYPCDVNSTGECGTNALHACCHDDSKIGIAKMLVLRGANVNCTDVNGDTPLILCAISGAVEIASLLLHNSCDVSLRNTYGNSPLHICCRIGGIERERLAILCISHGVVVDGGNSCEDCPLHIAAKYNQEHMVSILLEAGACANAKNGHGDTALAIASSHNHTSIVKILLEHGVCINSINSEGNAALHLACRQNHVEIVAMLLREPSCDISIGNTYSNTAFHQAAAGDSAACLWLLLTRERDEVVSEGAFTVASLYSTVPTSACRTHKWCHDQTNSFGDTPLYFAYYNHGADNDCVCMLINCGATGDAVNQDGDSVMLLACEGGDLATVEALVCNGSNPCIPDEEMRCALDLLDAASVKGIMRCWNWQRRKAFLLFLYQYGLIRRNGVFSSSVTSAIINMSKGGATGQISVSECGSASTHVGREVAEDCNRDGDSTAHGATTRADDIVDTSLAAARVGIAAVGIELLDSHGDPIDTALAAAVDSAATLPVSIPSSRIVPSSGHADVNGLGSRGPGAGGSYGDEVDSHSGSRCGRGSSGDASGGRPGGSDGAAGSMSVEEGRMKRKRGRTNEKYAACRSRYLNASVFQNLCVCRTIASFL
jgi:uncharacterized protein